jgi:hypothetical protein
VGCEAIGQRHIKVVPTLFPVVCVMLGGRGVVVMVVVRGLGGGFVVMMLVSFVVVLPGAVFSLWVSFFVLCDLPAVAVPREYWRRRARLLFLDEL